jgi:TolA-binding protein
MDQVTNTVGAMQTAVSDLTSTLNRIQAQLTDLGNAVKVLSTPPPPPPGQTTGSGGAPSTTDGASSVPPVNANDLYNAAQADRQGGKLDFALKEFADYLKYFGNTNFAPYAQFYIASIHYSQQNYQVAEAEFDTVIEKYPDTQTITAQAYLYKGKSLVALGQRTLASNAFKDVIKKYPGTDNAGQACTDLKGLGMNCPAPAAHPSPKKKD